MNTMLRHSFLAAAVLMCLWTPSFADTAAPAPAVPASPGASDAADVKARDENGQSALISVAADGNVDRVKALIAGGADVNAKYDDGYTALMVTANADCVKALLAAGADVNAANTTGGTPLHFAAALSQPDIAQLLLDKGANVNAKDFAGRTPLLVASLYGNAAMCQLFIDKGADINAATAKAPPMPTLIDVNTGATEDGLRQSISDWSDAKAAARTKAFWTNVAIIAVESLANAYSAAAHPQTVGFFTRGNNAYVIQQRTYYNYGYVSAKRIALKVNGGQGETGTEDFDASAGRTPLHNAITSGNIDTVKLLIDRGAKLDVADEDGITPMQLATEYDRDDIGTLLAKSGTLPLTLTQAIRYGSDDDVTRLLAANADVKAYDESGDTPLQIAAQYGRLAIVTALLEKGADVNALNSETSQTPRAAAAAGQTEVVRLLLSKGANMMVKGASDYTPLHAAAREGHTDIVQMLLEHKADVNTAGISAVTPLQEAVRGGHVDTVKVLLAAKARVDGGSRPPIYDAAEIGNNAIVMMLLDAGANPEVRMRSWFGNKAYLYDSVSAISAAAQNGHLDTVTLLLEQRRQPERDCGTLGGLQPYFPLFTVTCRSAKR